MSTEYLCTNRDGIYEIGTTVEEAYYNLQANQGPISIEECDFYKCTKIEVQQKLITIKKKSPC